jgi:peptidoglycan L-alanyl-D-glutamate endopeptidase CwlK
VKEEELMSNDLEIDFGLAEYQFELEQEIYGLGRFPVIDASVNTSKALKCLKGSGVNTIIRYYCRDPKGSWKIIGRKEADHIINQKLKLCIVSEASRDPSYFSYASGLLDAEYACAYGGKVIGQPHGSAIYFAIDFDATSKVLRNNVIPYFKGVIDKTTAAGSPYRIGVYGSGLTCRTLLDLKMVELAWLAQSTGWAEYKQFEAGNRWALLQKPTTHVCEIEVDYNEPSIADFGAFDSLNKVTAASALEVEEWSSALASSTLDGLDERFKAKVQLLLQSCAANKIKMVPYFGLRSPQQQAKLWRQSRSRAAITAGIKRLRDNGAPWLANILETTNAPKDKHVTNALPGLSWHQWGEALDCYREIGGKPNWDDRNYKEYADIAETNEIGLTAGGHWSSFQDWPHVQLRSAAGPQNVYSYATIDAKMKAMWGPKTLDMDIAALPTEHAGGQTEGVANLLKTLVASLRDVAAETPKDDGPYFFPKGIFKIDVSVGVQAETPTGEANAATTPILQARVSISGIDKE